MVPTSFISNDLITAHLYLPDAKNGYYRGTRFDWAGVIYSLKFEGHEYFGEWQQADDPLLHDRITGPVDSFEPVGYDKAMPGETFVRLGVGVLMKPEEDGFQWMFRYDIVDDGSWSTEQGANWIEFTQVVSDRHTDFPYSYTKRLTLIPGRAELVIDHVLENTGQNTLSSDVYNHNFFVTDAQQTGPAFVIRFPFAPVLQDDVRGFAIAEETKLQYLRPIPEGENIFTPLGGFGDTADDHRFEIENTKTKAGVRLTGDRPMSHLNYWSPSTTLCPEPFIDINIPPGQADRWSLHYEFYMLY